MASGGAILKSKFVRLWAGLEQGVDREVCLHCHGPGAGSFELTTGEFSTRFPVTSRELRLLLEGASMSLSTASLSAKITPIHGGIHFRFEPTDVSFVLARDHLALLVHSLGFDAALNIPDMPQRVAELP
jgi:hypothetical protein